MITEEEFLNKVSELMDTTKKDAMEKAERMFNSGCINKESFENNCILPKMFMTAYSYEMRTAWKPVSSNKKIEREIANIRRFI